MQLQHSNSASWRNAMYRYQHSMFPEGTAHHAAETGKVEALEAAVTAGEALGYPSSVTLQSRDEILQCMPLHVAAERGHDDAVKYLIGKRVDLDAGDGFMVTPLHLAAVGNHTPTLNLLLDAGANLTRQDSQGDQPLHWAATRGHEEACTLLLDRGGQVDAPNREGWTALHRAACNGAVGTARLLIHRGASLHGLTNNHATPLHLAAQYNQLTVMNLLLELGSRIDMRDKAGRTAADLCIGNGARALIQEHAEAAAAAGRPLVRERPQSVPMQQAAAAAAPVVQAAPRVRRKPKANDNLDADGFPVSVPAGDLADQTEEFEETQLLFVDGSVGSIQEAPEGMRQTLTSWVGGGPAAAAAAERSTASLSSSPSRSKLGAGQLQQQQQGGIDDVLLSDRRRSAGSVLAPGPRAPGPNQKFLDKYKLSKKGLFAP